MAPGAGEGPYVQTAVICETFIRGAESGRLTLVNILEGAAVTGTDLNEMEPFTIGPPLKLVISLWGGRTKGRYALALRPETPGGVQLDPIQLPPPQFSGQGAAGVDTILPMPLYEVAEEGTHWFDVLFTPAPNEEAVLLTRIPFIVRYQPQVTLGG